MHIYNSEVYCNSCGEAIKADLTLPEGDFDSDDYPEYVEGQSNWDYPPHCAAGPDCLEAISLPSGRKVGVILGGLSPVGVDYFRQAILSGGEVAELWADHFAEVAQ